MAFFYYTGGGGTWSATNAWSKLNTSGSAPYTTNTTGNPGADDVAILNVSAISIPNTTTGDIITVSKIYGVLPLSGTMMTTTTALNGSGTSFTTELAIGVIVRTAAGTSLGTVTQVISDTSAVVSGGATNASPILAYAGGGASATVTLNVTTNSEYNINSSNGIEGGQLAVVAPSVFIVAGAGNSSTTVRFNSASGNIRGGGTSGGANSGIKLNLTNSNIVVNCINLYGGITANDNYGLQNVGAGNNVTINATGEVTGVIGTAVVQQSTSGAITLNSDTIKGGTSVPGFLMAVNNSGTQVIAVTSITPSITCPAICVVNSSNVGGVNTSKLSISGNITTTSNSSNPIAAIQASNYYLDSSSIKVYDPTPTEITYSTGASASDAQYILSGQTVGGINGTLTLPTASKVLVSNGNFGIGGSGTTPTYIDANLTTANVRKNVAFGVSPQAGVLEVPSAASVLVGVPVDNTVGTLDIATSVWGAATKQITSIASGGITNGSIADNAISASKIAQSAIGTNIGAGTDNQSLRLQNASTDATVGAIVQSLT
jgi:hypothetical protein